jgi:mRNA interferase RelE/StbE
MKIAFDESFEKSIKKLKDNKVKQKIIDLIDEVENASELSQLANIKKMKGFATFYRIRLGDYRIGVELLDSSTILFILVAHRKDIYRYFP